jgi:uncharacterized membrane protein YfcA
MELYLLLFIIIFISSMLQSSTGFGFSIISTPFLLLLFDTHTAIKLNIILSLFVSLLMIYPLRKELDKGVLIRFTKGGLLCLPLGLLVFLFVDSYILKVVVSLLILLSTILLLFNFRFAQTNNKDTFAGGLSGFLTASIGLPGPPLLVYFTGISMEKGKQRSTTLAFYVFVYSFSILLQTYFGGWDSSVLRLVVLSLPISFVGILFGHWIYKYINQALFRKLSYVILFCSGSYLLYSTLYL